MKPSSMGKFLFCYAEQASGCDRDDHSELYNILQKNIHKTGILNCCKMDDNTGRCSITSKSEQCLCTVYIKINGGNKTYMEALEEYSRTRE
ncbi:MAG: hypothetical protein OEZ34_07205 [Spirochaetia bacterium]|nr:hypothetical protein [Spirochaetia bacterium]